MRKQLFFVCLFALIIGKVQAQTVKTDVLVIGNSNAAVAAGLQAAISGVKTTILLQAGGFDIAPLSAEQNSGLQATFLKKIEQFNPNNKQGSTFDKQAANEVLKTWTDSIKNLTVIRNIMWTKADRSGNNWSFKLSDGRTIKPKVLINPADNKLNGALNIVPGNNHNWTKLSYDSTMYRTSVAAGRNLNGTAANLFSMYQFFIPLQENLVWVSDANSMLLGQAAGATAAYAAFFNSKTSLSNLKTIQGELINYKLDLMPFADIKQPDTNWKAIQMVGLTGILKAEIKGSLANFLPDQLVSTQEIKQPIKDLYYKAQIWFDDYKSDQMTVGSTIDMICYVGNKSLESTKKEIEKKWKTAYKFTSEMAYNKPITRREFAVLLQDYMPPFNVNIDKAGKVVR